MLKSKAEEGFFKNVLNKNGAIILRLGNIDSEVLSKYVKTIGYGSKLVPFVQNGSTAERTQITDVFTTANEGPGEIELYQHNEFSLFKTYPGTLFFACTKYTAKGGQTQLFMEQRLLKTSRVKIQRFSSNWPEEDCYLAKYELTRAQIELDGRIITLLEKQFSLKIHWSKERRKLGKFVLTTSVRISSGIWVISFM